MGSAKSPADVCRREELREEGREVAREAGTRLFARVFGAGSGTVKVLKLVFIHESGQPVIDGSDFRHGPSKVVRIASLTIARFAAGFAREWWGIGQVSGMELGLTVA